MTVKTWSVNDLPGDGRGGVFWNSDETFTDELTGLSILDHNGYDEDEEFDDFGHEYYSCTVRGTEEQVKEFINEYFYGEGEFFEE